MLTNWKISNFKPVKGELSLSLAPLTLLVGANSAGKSSIIQSMLLIKQTLQYATSSRPIALNGPLVKLGDFRDVCNSFADVSEFGICWEYSSQRFGQLFPSLSREYDAAKSPTQLYRQDISEMAVSLRFGYPGAFPDDNSLLLQPNLLKSEVGTRTRSDDGTMSESFVSVGAKYQLYPDTPELLEPQSTLSNVSSRYQVQSIDVSSREHVLEDHPQGELLGALIRHFLPSHIIVGYDAAIRDATRAAERICSPQRLSPITSEVFQMRVPPTVTSILNEWFQNNADTLFPNGVVEHEFWRDCTTLSELIETLQRVYRRFRYRTVKVSFPSMLELQPQIAEALCGAMQTRPSEDTETPRNFNLANFHATRYFNSFVRYLGPLRDEPKPLYPLEAVLAPTEVGYRGEHTAAVLQLNKSRNVDYIPPERFLRFAEVGLSLPEKRRDQLQNAVVDWLSYMGVAEDIRSEDRGKIGHVLQIRTSGMPEFYDLTNVGVGVSQVVPIVVMALLAPPGSLLIFEQPELHLHPRVQSRLADFFIAMSLSGRQCLIETHSEYIIHRIRRRIAEASGDDLTNLSRIFFVERDDGVTSCRAVELTRYGAIVDWPKDFFDQSEEEGSSILAAATSKRRHEKQLIKK